MYDRLKHAEDRIKESHEINVTPFIDIMLVLLIIFMVSAPLSTVSVPVDLPVGTSRPAQQPADPVYLTLQADYSLSIGDHKTTVADLAQTLDRATGSDHGVRILLRADTQIDYGHLMAVMNLLSAAGYLKVALVGVEPVPRTAKDSQ